MTVSVIISVRNGEPYIAEAIRSALAQGDCIGEVIVANDLSTDDTEGAALGVGDPRIKVVPATRRGLPAGRNIGVEASTGDWLYFLDADDLVRPGAIPRLLAAAAAVPQADVVYGDYDRVTEDGAPFGRRHRVMGLRRKPSGDILRNFLCGNLTVVGAQIVRRSAYARVGGFNEDMKVSDDWEFWCRVAARGHYHFVPGLYVVSYRVHRESIMHTKPRPFEDFLPAIDSVFADPDIVARVPEAERARLRARCEAAKLGYISTVAVRLAAYREAIALAARSVRRSPAHAHRTIARVAGAFIGL